MSGVHGIQLVILLLLIAVAAFAVAADRLKTPYPIVLVIAGLFVSFIPHVPRMPLSPDLVFLVFLPPLLFAAAWQTSWREFRHNLVPVLMLAFGLVGLTVIAVALFSDRFITALDFKSGFLLGAVVATTDAIAATSMASKLGLPARVVEILEGESLLNDATGLLALEFGVQMLQTGSTPSISQGALRLLWLAAGGVAVGLLVGLGVWFVERWIDDGPVEMVISVVAPYAAYLAAEEVHTSGVLAVVACGLYLGRQSTEIFSPRTRMQVQHGWESLNFVLNGMVFLLIGLQLPQVMTGIRGYGVRTLLVYGVVFSLILVVLRLLWIYPAMWGAHFFNTVVLRRNQPVPPSKDVFVLGWTGMRGVVALAAAFSLPETLSNGQPFAQRNLILFLTFAVILVTLVGQGLTLPQVIRMLRFRNRGDGDEELNARRLVLQEAIQFLEGEQRGDDGQFDRGFQHLLERYRHRLEALDYRKVKSGGLRKRVPEFFKRYSDMTRQAMEVERATAIRLRDEGHIGDSVLTKIQNELDLTETRQQLHR